MIIKFPPKSLLVKACPLLVSIILLFSSPIDAQEPNHEIEDILSEVRASMQRAERLRVPLFSPTTFSAANERFQGILEGLEKGESPEIISRDCEETLKIIEAAFERARISQDELRPLIVVRDETIGLVEERLAAWQRDPNFFKGRLLSESDFREEQSYHLPKTESMLGEAILQIEIGNLDGARSLAGEIEFEYRNSAIEILKNTYVDETRKRLAEVAESSAVESYQKANAELDELDRFLYSPDAREVPIGELHKEIQHGIQYALSLVAMEAPARGDLSRREGVTAKDLVALREFAMGSAPSRRALEQLFIAEDDYRRAVSQEEGGIRITDQQAALAAESAYREVIIISFREGTLTESRKQLEESRERLSPDEYQERLQNYEKAKGLFEQSQGPGISSKDFLKMIKKSKDWMFFSPLPSGSLPDLIVELWSVPESQKKYAHLKWLSPYPPVVDQLTTVSAVVKNIGIGDVDQKFSTELYVDGKLVKTWTFSPFLKAEKMNNPLRRGETMILDYTGKFSVGKHNFHWKVDTKKEITESDESESSNELKASYVWKASTGLPDLVVEDIFHEGDLLVGNLTTWKIKIKNKGNTDVTTPFLTSLSSGGVQFGSFWLDTLKAGKSKIFKTKQSTSIIAGNYTYEDTIVGTVDVSNVISEANKGNNVKIEHFTISFVDLAVTSLTVIPANPVVHEPFTYSLDIKNYGPADVSSLFKIRIMPGQLSAKGTTEPMFLTFPADKLPLKSGNSVNLKQKVTLGYGGSYQASVIADYADSKGVFKKVYLEKNSANNTKTFNFNLKQTYYVKIAKVEYTDCDDGVIIHLDRSGGFWKGTVKVQLMSGSTVIPLAKPFNKSEVIIHSHQMKSEEMIPNMKYLGYNLKVKVYAVDGGTSIPSIAPEKTALFPKTDQIVLNSITPSSGAKGSKVLVTLKGKALSSSYFSYGPSVSVKPRKCTECWDYDGISVKVKNYSYNQVLAELDIKANASTGKKWIHIYSKCHGGALIPFTITESKPQVPTTKEYTLYLQKKAGPAKGGIHPFSGSILPIPNGVLQTITNVNTALGTQVGVRIIKTGYTTDDCDKSKAVVDLVPGKSTSDFKGASLSNGLSIAACIYNVKANVVPNQVALKITYTK